MDFHPYVFLLGTWVSAVFGFLYLLVFLWVGDAVSLASTLALFAMALAIKSYGLARKPPESER